MINGIRALKKWYKITILISKPIILSNNGGKWTNKHE